MANKTLADDKAVRSNSIDGLRKDVLKRFEGLDEQLRSMTGIVGTCSRRAPANEIAYCTTLPRGARRYPDMLAAVVDRAAMHLANKIIAAKPESLSNCEAKVISIQDRKAALVLSVFGMPAGANLSDGQTEHVAEIEEIDEQRHGLVYRVP